MLNYILRQWSQKKGILALIVIGFFVGSLFLSVGASFSVENYNYIMDQNSGEPDKQLEINVQYSNEIEISELFDAFSKMAEYGELQVVSLASVDLGGSTQYQFVPVIVEEQKGWHIPIISGRYFGKDENEIIIGKEVAEDKNITTGELMQIGSKEYNVVGVAGRSNKETIWDNTIYIKMSSFIEEYANLFFDEKNDENVVYLVLKNGKNEFISNFDNIQSYCAGKNISVNFEDINQYADDSSVFNSVIITILSSGMIFVIAMINIVNLMIYWTLERRNEIGMMKALGATNRFIIKWVVIELVIMSLIGALCALACQLIVGTVFFNLLSANDICIDISWINCFAAIGVSTLCGMLSAIAVSVNTLKFSPIEAISCE